jgi:hypothetical protein
MPRIASSLALRANELGMLGGVFLFVELGHAGGEAVLADAVGAIAAQPMKHV